ncbi:MAG: hypothetical protein Q4C13_00140 [Clostridia bacterium]|nr:hypothetical protein [Clostridia bacterium]
MPSKRRLLPILAAALLLVSALALSACDSDKYDSRNAVIEAVADAEAILLYEDPSLVTYTVTVPKQCVKITIQRLSGETGADGEPAVLDFLAFTEASPGVSVVTEGSRSVWTIPCDFGTTALDGVRVVAQIPMGKKVDLLNADVAISAAYPEYGEDDLLSACQRLVRQNDDTPHFFLLEPDAEAALEAILESLFGGESDIYAMSRAGAVITDPGFLYPESGRPVLASSTVSGELDGRLVPEGRRLYSLYIPNTPYEECYAAGGAQDGLRVSDSARVLLMGDTPIDEALYPVAAFLQREAAAVFADIDMATASDYELAAVAYDRVYNSQRMAVEPEGVGGLSEAERAYYRQTAYGLIAGFGGDSRGLADAFYLLCGYAGLPCLKLDCETVGGDAVCVNALLLDGEWYIVDAHASVMASAEDEDANIYARFCLNAERAAAFYRFAAPEPPLSDSDLYYLLTDPVAAAEAAAAEAETEEDAG